MENLIKRMQMDLVLQGYSEKTVKSYSWHVGQFVQYVSADVESLGEEDIRRYLYHIKTELNYSVSNLSQAFSAIKFLYRNTLQMPLKLSTLRGPRQSRRLPVVLSRQELKQLFDSVDNLKHRTIFITAYAAGLRLSEVAHLRVSDIDSGRMQIRVEQGKGKKDRYTLLSERLLQRLREYWRIYRPKQWLFPGQSGVKPISITCIQRVFKEARNKTGISKPITMHTLRHSFATHLLEQGVDIFTIQKLLGHKYLQSTVVYLHLQQPMANTVRIPVNQMLEGK
jgi:site-specific recombinase XerD